ncbi:MAG: hypothetical protein ACOX9R_13470 [Armatimonadota bacterium]
MFRWRSQTKVAAYAVGLCFLAMGAFWLGTQADHALGVGPSVALAQGGGAPTVADRASTIGGVTVGEVLVNGDVVIRMRTSAGGFSAPERATVVAQRLNRWLSGRYSPYDLAVRRGTGGAAELRAHGDLIVDVNPAEARALGSTAIGLANAWRSNIQIALGVEPAPATQLVGDGTGAAATGAQAQPEPPVAYGSKIVPILSVGGTAAIGGARLNGPRDSLRDVVACTQVEMTFRNFLEIDIYVPVKTRGGLDRVQQVGVTALGDLRL